MVFWMGFANIVKLLTHFVQFMAHNPIIISYSQMYAVFISLLAIPDAWSAI